MDDFHVMRLHFVGLLSLVLSKKAIDIPLLTVLAVIGYSSVFEGRFWELYISSDFVVAIVTHLVITNTWNVDIIKCVIRSSRSNNIQGSHEVVNKILTVQIQTISIYVVQE